MVDIHENVRKQSERENVLGTGQGALPRIYNNSQKLLPKHKAFIFRQRGFSPKTVVLFWLIPTRKMRTTREREPLLESKKVYYPKYVIILRNVSWERDLVLSEREGFLTERVEYL